jgi:hypothetical protein
MRVCLIATAGTWSEAAIGPHLDVQVRLFRERGDQVQLIEPGARGGVEASEDQAVADDPCTSLSELLVYHCADEVPLAASLRRMSAGTVVMHDHGSLSPGRVPVPWVDLCLVNDAGRGELLASYWDLASERLCVLPPHEQEADYRLVLNAALDRAVRDERPASGRAGSRPCGNREDTQPGTVDTDRAWEAELLMIRNEADVMLRDYVVRSRIPVLGGLVAWVRRNLTSHLREPYLDPTLERQVTFNRAVVDWMEQMQARLEALEARPTPGRSQEGARAIGSGSAQKGEQEEERGS